MWTLFGSAVLLSARILYLAFPVIFAAAVHIVVIRLNLFAALKKPIDFGSRLFGSNKTWRGAVVMIGVSSVGMAFQQLFRVRWLEFFDYGAINAWLGGALLGLGFVLAELPNSFIKRRCGVPPGEQATGAKYAIFTALDQFDSVVGCLLGLAILWPPPWHVVVAALFLCSLVHVAFNFVFVAVGLKRRAL